MWNGEMVSEMGRLDHWHLISKKFTHAKLITESMKRIRIGCIVSCLGVALSAIILYITFLPTMLGRDADGFTRYGWPFTISVQTDYANYSVIGLLLDVLVACAIVQVVFLLLGTYVKAYQNSSFFMGMSVGVGVLGMVAHYVAFMGLAP